MQKFEADISAPLSTTNRISVGLGPPRLRRIYNLFTKVPSVRWRTHGGDVASAALASTDSRFGCSLLLPFQPRGLHQAGERPRGDTKDQHRHLTKSKKTHVTVKAAYFDLVLRGG